MAREVLKDVLRGGWEHFNAKLRKLDEREVLTLLRYEAEHGERRASYLRRLFARYNEMRRVRELRAWLKKARSRSY